VTFCYYLSSIKKSFPLVLNKIENFFYDKKNVFVIISLILFSNFKKWKQFIQKCQWSFEGIEILDKNACFFFHETFFLNASQALWRWKWKNPLILSKWKNKNLSKLFRRKKEKKFFYLMCWWPFEIFCQICRKSSNKNLQNLELKSKAHFTWKFIPSFQKN